MKNLNTQNNKTFFSAELSRAVSELVLKYNLKETTENFFNKFDAGQKTNGQIIVSIAKKVANKKIKMEEIISSVENLLKTSEKASKEIAKEIELNITPIIENFVEPPKSQENILEEQKEDIVLKLKSPIGVLRESITQQNNETKTMEEKILPEIADLTEGQNKILKKPDDYREPIE